MTAESGFSVDAASWRAKASCGPVNTGWGSRIFRIGFGFGTEAESSKSKTHPLHGLRPKRHAD